MSSGGLTSLIGFWNQQSSQAAATPSGGGGRRWESPRSLPNSPSPTKWEPPSITVKDCEPEKGVVREGGFALGVSRGREEVRCDRREGEQAKGKPGLRLAMGSPPCSPLASPNSFKNSPSSPNSFKNSPASPNSFRSTPNSPGFSQSPLPSPGASGRGSSGPKQASPFARFRQLEDQASKSNPGSPVSPMPGGTSLYRNSSLPASSPRPTNLATPATAARSGSGAKEMILMWVQNRLKDYPIPMTNFSTCWNDGLAFCALIHVFYPDNFDWYALDAQNRRYNFTLGFDKAEELAGIYPLLEVDDMVKFKKPDWKCVFTYVQSFYRRFRDGRSPPPKPVTASSTGQAPLSEVALACIASQEAEKRGKEIASQLQTKTAPIDASQQLVKRQAEVSEEDTKEAKTVEDPKTKDERQTKEERKKKNKARPAPLKNLALIRHEDDVQSSQSQTQPIQVGNEKSVEAEEKKKGKEDKAKNNEEEEEEARREEGEAERKSSRPKMPSQPPPPVSL